MRPRGHCQWPRQGVDQPSLITPPSVVKPTAGARGVEQIVRNFSEAVRVSLYPCPNLLARSRASNHKQGHDALSSHTDRMTLREAYWEALQRTGQICSPTDQLPSEPFVMPGVSCKTMFNNELWTSKPPL